MNVPQTVRDYLDQRGLPYQLVLHAPTETPQETAAAVQIPLQRLIRVILLKDAQGPVMAILPSSHIVDFSLLYPLLERDLEPLYGTEVSGFFPGCAPGARPPLPGLFGLPALVESSLTELAGELYFDTGSHEALAAMTSHDFKRLLSGERWAHFAPPLDTLTLQQQAATKPAHITEVANRYTPIRLSEGLDSIKELPALPDVARQVLALYGNPQAGISELVRWLEHHPDWGSEVSRWIQTGVYGHSSNTASLQDALQATLGFDLTLNLLLATAIGRRFRIAPGGPLGMSVYWRHGLYCATLVGELVKGLPPDIYPRPGLAHLGGLLHQFGYLLLGQLFPAQFFILNRFLAVNNHLPPSLVEQYVLGVGHEFIGAWLLETWRLPRELVAAVRWHHQEDYSQPYAEYANLVLIANRLLRRLDIGDETTEQLPIYILGSLGLDEEQALAALARVRRLSMPLDDLAKVLSA